MPQWWDYRIIRAAANHLGFVYCLFVHLSLRNNCNKSDVSMFGRRPAMTMTQLHWNKGNVVTLWMISRGISSAALLPYVLLLIFWNNILTGVFIARRVHIFRTIKLELLNESITNITGTWAIRLEQKYSLARSDIFGILANMLFLLQLLFRRFPVSRSSTPLKTAYWRRNFRGSIGLGNNAWGGFHTSLCLWCWWYICWWRDLGNRRWCRGCWRPRWWGDRYNIQ